MSQQKLSEETNNRQNGPALGYVKPNIEVNRSQRPPRHSTGTQFETNWGTSIDRSSESLRSPIRQNDTSMRRQLLRRIWSKEFRQLENRSGSWSPPLRKTPRRLNVDQVVEKCIECSKLDLDYSASDSKTKCVETSTVYVTSATTISECISIQETSTTKTDSSEQCIAKADLSNDDETKYLPNNAHNVVASDYYNDNHHSINTSNIDRSNLTTNEPLSTSDTCDRYDSAPMSSRQTADSQITSNSTRSNSQESSNILENLQNKIDTEQYHELSNVDQYIANLLIDSLNNVLTTTESNVECYAARRDDNNFSSGQSDVKMIPKHLEKTKSNDLIEKENQFLESSPDIDNNNQSGSLNRIIYFPRYVSQSKDNASITSSVLTDNEIDNSYLVTEPSTIPVQSGSNYPSAEFVVSAVSRLVHRTESMEAQRASTSPYNCDSDTSLVDSLDDPSSPRPDDFKQIPVDPQYEKSQSFFVPIMDLNEQKNIEPINMNSAMPDKLREKMKKRLLDMEMRKKSLEKRIMIKKTDKRTHKATKNASPIPDTSCIINSKNSRPNKIKSKFLQSEVGQLETYTIDKKGNMKFNTTNKANRVNKIRSQPSTSSSSIHSNRNVVKKPVQSRRNVLSIINTPTKKPFVIKNPRRKEVQQLTLYQSDLMTPDTECGPRRMYQKTEIRDGTKRIEILEIVECIDSSGSSNDGPIQDDQIQIYESGNKFRQSKIPVPVFRSGSKNSGKDCSRVRSSGKIFVTNLNKTDGEGNTKVDQMIANLLIEALCHPEHQSIEFVKSTSDIFRTLTPNSSTGTNKPSINGFKISEGTSGSSNRRLTSGAIKYQQMFDVIPEEKSSVSVDSSTDDGFFKDNGANETTSKTSIENGLCNEPASIAKSSNSSGSPTSRTSRGKEGVESESEEAWMGFLKQHNDNNYPEGTSRVGVLVCA